MAGGNSRRRSNKVAPKEIQLENRFESNRRASQRPPKDEIRGIHKHATDRRASDGKRRSHGTALPKDSKWRILRRRRNSAVRITLAAKANMEFRGKLGEKRESKAVKKVKLPNVVDKMRETTFEMEPLCCVESCLVREACFVTIGAHISLLVAICICVTLNIHLDGIDSIYTFPSDQPLAHSLFLSMHYVHLIVAVLASAWLTMGLQRYEAPYLKVYKRYQIVALVLQVVFFAALVAAMAMHKHKMTAVNVVFAVLIVCDVLLLIWQIPVVIETDKYFTMCKVLIDMGEK